MPISGRTAIARGTIAPASVARLPAAIRSSAATSATRCVRSSPPRTGRLDRGFLRSDGRRRRTAACAAVEYRASADQRHRGGRADAHDVQRYVDEQPHLVSIRVAGLRQFGHQLHGHQRRHSSTYTVTTSDEGHTIQSVVTAGNAGGTSMSFSPVTATVPPPAAPSNSTVPAVSGQAVQGQTLSTTNGSWTNSPTSYAYQWQDCDSSGANCSSIGGATSSSYPLVSGDVGHTIRVVVTASNAGGAASASSAATQTVQAASGGGGGGSFTCPSGVRCFYIANSGSDSNSGTSESQPWAHAPGMPTFTGTYAHQTGDEFIFKGGDTWARANFPLAVPGRGSAATPDYYGADPSWYSGASFTRPTFDGGGTGGGAGTEISTTDDSFFDLRSKDYITLDDFHLTHYLATGSFSYGGCALVQMSSGGSSSNDQHITVKHFLVDNMYIDKTAASGGGCAVFLGYVEPPYAGQSLIEYSTIAGDGNTYGTADECVSHFENNVVHDLADQVFPCGQGQVSGNLLYNCGYPHFPTDGGTSSGTHNDMIQDNQYSSGGTTDEGPLYIFNNVFHDNGNDGSNNCESTLVGNNGETDYIFNNVYYNLHENAIGLTQESSSGGSGYGAGLAAYVWNNTIEGGQTNQCVRLGHPDSGRPWPLVKIQNNLCITTGSMYDSNFTNSSYVGNFVQSNNATLTPSQATADGYTTSQNYVYSPTSMSNPTTGTGANLSDNCFGSVAALCQEDATYGGARTTGIRGASWDEGAYQYSDVGLGTKWYVDPGATGGANNGTSWANAWTSFASINWTNVQPGDIVYISGGSTSQTYTSTLTINKSGQAGAPITIAAGVDPGHDGDVIMDYSSCDPTCTTNAISVNGTYITLEGWANGRWQINNLYNTSSGTTSKGVQGNAHQDLTVDHLEFTNDNNPIINQSTVGTDLSYNTLNQVRGDDAMDISNSDSAGSSWSTSWIYGNYDETVCHHGSTCDTAGGSTASGPDGSSVGNGVSIHDNHFKEIALNETTSGEHPDMIQQQGF